MGKFKELVEKSDIINEIKKYLYEDDGHDNWKDFVDNQSIGDCQSNVSYIIKKFPTAKKIFGEIEVDEPYKDEDGEEQTLMTHHWVEIEGKEYDFSKGTLKDYIDFDDIYDPEIEDDSIYHGF